MSNGNVPEPVLRGAEEALRADGHQDARVTDARPIGGGCINRALRMATAEGTAVFVKWNPDPPDGFFEAEVDGLEALRAQGGPRVPRPLGHGRAPEGGAAWLVMEFLEPGQPGRDFGERLGRAVAELHRPAHHPPGWHLANFIGSLPQSNAPHDSWARFWQDERLLPQLRRARDAGLLQDREIRTLEGLLDRLDELLAGRPHPGTSLLHGDLWSGNIHVGPAGEPTLLDPAVYRGDREVDLAMADLFGGFPAGFERGYGELLPAEEGYEAVRRDVYQLYPLLVHVNLFGRGYVAPALEAARRAQAYG